VARHRRRVIGTLGQVINPSPASTTSKVAGIAGSIVVALAGVAATQATAGSRDKLWIKARAPEKASRPAYSGCCASAPPFDGADRANVLADKAEKTMLDLKGVELRPGTIKDPPRPLTVEDYIKARVDDQINFYNSTAIKHQERADFWRFCGLVAASSGAILGTVSALFSLAPWVALLSTVVTSLTADVKGQQYESMIALYQATASRLSLLKDKWLDSGKSDADTAERNTFIKSCEDTMSLENGAWVAKWAERTPA
jgi:hypothetical protein